MDPKRPSRPGMGPTPPVKPGQSGPAGQRPGAPGPQGSGAASTVARRAAGLGETLDQLSREVRKLQIDFERFFNGGIPVPPEELRTRIQMQIRQLRNLNLTALDSFRLGDLEARFNSYNELFNRRLRDREEGRHPQAAHQAPPPTRRHDPEKGILVGDRVDPEAAEALYCRLASAPGDSPKFDLDSFQTYLVKQAAAIRAKTGCSEVQFRLAVEDGKTKLKARPVQGSQGV